MDSFAQLLDLGVITWHISGSRSRTGSFGGRRFPFVISVPDAVPRNREAAPLQGRGRRAHRDQLRGSVGLPLVGGGAASGSQFSSPSVEPPFVRALCANRK